MESYIGCTWSYLEQDGIQLISMSKKSRTSHFDNKYIPELLEAAFAGLMVGCGVGARLQKLFGS